VRRLWLDNERDAEEFLPFNNLKNINAQFRLASVGLLDHRTVAVTRSLQALSAPHTKIETTVRYLGVDVEDALVLSEHTEI
jgi:hypothetical protein